VTELSFIITQISLNGATWLIPESGITAKSNRLLQSVRNGFDLAGRSPFLSSKASNVRVFRPGKKQIRGRKTDVSLQIPYSALDSKCHNAIMELRMKRSFFVLVLATLSVCGLQASGENPKPENQKPENQKTDAPKAKKTIYDFSLVDLDGKETPLSSFKGKLLLIVNLASQSIYHDQIDALTELQKTYADQGLVVIGIPSADFGAEELKDPAALRKYYRETAHAGFPIFACASLRGVNEIPLYRFLTDPKQSLPGGDIHWNFTKFLVDRQGLPLARYEVHEDPADVDFHVTIENALAGKLKKKGESAKDDKAAGEDDSDDDDE
jgi:glutathione peroxidase